MGWIASASDKISGKDFQNTQTVNEKPHTILTPLFLTILSAFL
jgi:hypothetical protein